jgi:hypothetical protein
MPSEVSEACEPTMAERLTRTRPLFPDGGVQRAKGAILASNGNQPVAEAFDVVIHGGLVPSPRGRLGGFQLALGANEILADVGEPAEGHESISEDRLTGQVEALELTPEEIDGALEFENGWSLEIGAGVGQVKGLIEEHVVGDGLELDLLRGGHCDGQQRMKR